ncbi:hypothetical protein FOZ63_031385, partial [Perkinsus olseni]
MSDEPNTRRGLVQSAAKNVIEVGYKRSCGFFVLHTLRIPTTREAHLNSSDKPKSLRRQHTNG